MSNSAVLLALADALEAASRVLRQQAEAGEAQPAQTHLPQGAVARARAIHPSLGPRQTQIIATLEQYGRAGTNTGVISRAIRYSQSNVHLTLKYLMRDGLVERDSQARPHTYWLSDLLLGEGQ